MPEDGATVVSGNASANRQPTEGGTACLVVLYGQNLGRRHLLDKAMTVIGRASTAGIQIDQDSVSREHAQIQTRDSLCHIVDLGSTNGTWVNDARVDSAELQDGDLLQIGQTVFKFLTGTNLETKYHEQIYHLTTTDGLTGAATKRAFLENLERETRRAHRYARRVSLVLCDLDHFKQVNDTWGHLAGDAVLKDLSRLAMSHLRKVDTFARYGGEEFAIILPEIDRSGALAVCEKLRVLIQAHTFTYNEASVPVTMSFGVATLDLTGGPPGTPPSDPATLVAQADAKLYEAKQEGRNRVCV